MPLPVRVLFVCPDNTSRSQMAEGWLRHLGGDRFVARSAGVEPRHLHPLATAAMQEAGVEVAQQRGKGLDAIQRERFDLVVTLCDTLDASAVAVVDTRATRHTPLDDPAWLETEDGADFDEFLRARDEVRQLVEALINEL